MEQELENSLSCLDLRNDYLDAHKKHKGYR